MDLLHNKITDGLKENAIKAKDKVVEKIKENETEKPEKGKMKHKKQGLLNN